MILNKTKTWRRGAATAVVSTALAFGAVLGPLPVASADVIGQLACEFGTAPGSGTVSNLLGQSVTLSAQGYRPSATNLAAIQDSLHYRPSQTQMIEALQNTVAAQQNTRTLAAAAAAGGGPGSTISVNQGPVTGGDYDPFGTQAYNNDPFPEQTLVGTGVNLGGSYYTIGNGGQYVVPMGC